MYVYADIRCLQDENYAFRGVGHHSATLLQGRREHLPESYLIGFYDPALPTLPDCYRELFDEIKPWSQATLVEQESIFIELSPMTHDLAVCGRILDRQRILTCALIYDFIPLDVPDRYLANSSALHGYTASMLWLEAFNVFSPISEYSQRRLFELLGVHPNDSFVSGVALRPAFEAIMDSNARHRSHDILPMNKAARVRSRPTKRDYFFFVGGGDPRKNIDVILPAHASLVKSGFDTDLVIVGSYPPEYQAAITKQYVAHEGNPTKLLFRHGITDAELADWYFEAKATICSSHIEGFSLPVIEAIACGSPMLASDCEAHRELVTDSNMRFPSTDDAALRGLMFRVLTEPAYREWLIEEQAAAPERFLAGQVHEHFWIPLREHFYSKFQPASEFAGYHASSSRPTLAIISPFPPERSGVADYTRRTVEALADKACVDIFTEAAAPLPTVGVNAFHPTSEWAYLSGRYDRVMTVVGNSHFHIKPIELQQAFGGPCLIHDNRLSELYAWWKGPHYFHQMACRSMGREVSLEESQSWIRDPGTLPGIFFDDLIESSNPLLVHSRGIQKQIAKQYATQAEYLPFCCYRGFDEAELIPTSRQAARKKLNIPDSSVLIISLGIVGQSKAPEQCIDAIEHLRHAGVPAILHFVGSTDAYKDKLIAHAKRLGIESMIHFCGDWISDEDYRNYVLAADFAIQLRTHFFGGLSGAMLDCIASGLPTVANEDLAEALDSPQSVLRISDRLLARDVSTALLQAYNRGMHFNRLADCRTEYLKTHSFDHYADELLKVLKLTPSPTPPASISPPSMAIPDSFTPSLQLV